MNKLHLILRLLIEGKSCRHINRTVSVWRYTVNKYVVIFGTQPYSLTELYKLPEGGPYEIVKPSYKPKTSSLQLQEHFNWVVKELKKVGITKLRLYGNYKAIQIRLWRLENYKNIYQKMVNTTKLVVKTHLK